MLKSKFTKTDAKFKAQKIFTDRVEPREVFKTSIGLLDSNPQEIIVYYGKGGIGKTSLLKKLYNETEQLYLQVPDRKIHSIYVSLEAYDYSNPVNVLLAIRNGIEGECGLFDYAMLQYCTKARLSVEEIMQKNSFLSSPIMGVLNECISLGTQSACIPAATLQKCISFIKDHNFRKKYKEEIEEIETFTEFEIFERLPYYLGLCISFASEKGHEHVLFLDSYESMLARTEFGTTSVEREEWIQELFLSSGRIRIVIASRDRLRWDQMDSDWKNYMQQHLLKNLSDEDSRWFLENVPIKEPGVIETIIRNAGGVPLYLDMCVSLYEDDKNKGKVFELTSSENGEKIISRYIRHLSTKDKAAISVLAALRFFDVEFADALLRRRQLMYETDELKELLDKSIFVAINEETGLWKVDESVRLHQRARIARDKATEILGSILDCIIEKTEGRYYPHLSLVMESVCSWPDTLEVIEEKCLQAIECYANAGFWSELHEQLELYINHSDKRLQALAVMEELIYLRRTGQLREAEKLSNTYPLDRDFLGNWYYMYQFMKTQIRHLLGYYEESLLSYKALVDEMDLIRSTIPDHIYIAPCMKYADLLFLNGKFEESLARVRQLIEGKNLTVGDEIELMRIKGHIYRFRKQYAEAELIYSTALKLAEKHGMAAYKGKLYTNMTEALSTKDPQTALEWFCKAEEENSSAGNEIEYGKALAAASAAYTMLGNYEEALSLSNRAVAMAEKTGYLSGKAFALAALFFVKKQEGKKAEASEIKEQLVKLIEQIGVYKYILEGMEV